MYASFGTACLVQSKAKKSKAKSKAQSKAKSKAKKQSKKQSKGKAKTAKQKTAKMLKTKLYYLRSEISVSAGATRAASLTGATKILALHCLNLKERQ